MIWLAILGSLIGAAAVIGKNILFPLDRLEEWDSKKWPIQFTNGVSFIYDQPESNVVILFSHGNFGNLTYCSLIREVCRSKGWGLIVYDYYGYGASTYVPKLAINEGTLQASIWEIYKFLRNSGKQVILMGESLGCYPTSWLASHNFKDVKAVILNVPFDKLATVAGIFFNSATLGQICAYPMGQYDNMELCAKIRCPIMITRALYDEIMPICCADNISRVSPSVQSICTVECYHNGYLIPETITIMEDFIRKNLASPKKNESE